VVQAVVQVEQAEILMLQGEQEQQVIALEVQLPLQVEQVAEVQLAELRFLKVA